MEYPQPWGCPYPHFLVFDLFDGMNIAGSSRLLTIANELSSRKTASLFFASTSHCYKRVALINPACLVVFTTVDVLKSIQLAMSGREDPYLQFALLPLGFVIIPSRTQQ
ncbi:hypothetical protein NC653_004839 [Populus alba x Populus x berolinensis]|uniref:Uncharacterized protein n=1 Tax=Populus alba x Populus x berolinensis TaxID=444605 RepID=A0AAD6RYE9_9ROSI|nr:hypothetical protein NC653_004839 [Populus alba x Populus x berolinensis]